jgi:hypothetical protein
MWEKLWDHVVCSSRNGNLARNTAHSTNAGAMFWSLHWKQWWPFQQCTYLWPLNILVTTKPFRAHILSVQLSDYDNATYFLIHNYEAFVHQSFMCLRKRQEWWSIHINTESIYLLPLFLMRFITLNPPSQQMKHTDNTTLIQWEVSK